MDNKQFKYGDSVLVEGEFIETSKHLNNSSVIKVNDIHTILPTQNIVKHIKPIVSNVAIKFYYSYKDSYFDLYDLFEYVFNDKIDEDIPCRKELQEWLHANGESEVTKQRELALATLFINGMDAVDLESPTMYHVPIKNLVYKGKVQYLSKDKEDDTEFFATRFSNNFVQKFFWDEIPEEYRKYAEEVK